MRIAIDTGGTFTDLVSFDARSGQVLFHKVSSTPDDPSRALVAGVMEILEKGAASRAGVDLLVHGTTVATNAILQRAGAKTALITTAGFRDVLHIQRQDRPRLYDLRSRRAEPLIPRSLRMELNERITHDGAVLAEIDHGQLDEIIASLQDRGIEAIAVGLLHSYANPAHEREVGRVLAEKMPAATVCLSHQFVGEQGEYERLSTCAMNAFVQPVMQRYLERIESGLNKGGVLAPLFVMKSNGGVMAAGLAGKQCVQTILSGPAGGVVAGAAIAKGHCNSNLITADMGGTSFDVSVIHQGRVEFARDAEMAGLAMKVPMLDIHTVGAGGGSIAWIDTGGSLRVGPQSAGAEPGPACYGRGGAEPTVTDANLVLGRLAENTFAGGGIRLDLEAARRAIHDKIAAPLKLTIGRASEGLLRVVHSTMTAAIRKLTVGRGYDPRSFTLCAFGGAGPLHGAELADEMGVRETLIPLAPGVTSAVGLLMSNLREDRVRTEVSLLSDVQPRRLESILADLEADAKARLATAADTGNAVTTHTFGLRYYGQGYELPVKLDGEPLEIDALADAFHREHQRMYGYARPEEPVELVSLWVSVLLDLGAIRLPQVRAGSGATRPASTRPVYFRGQFHETAIHARDAMLAGTTLTGPAIIEQLDSTTAVWPGQKLEVDQYGQLLLGPIGNG